MPSRKQVQLPMFEAEEAEAYMSKLLDRVTGLSASSHAEATKRAYASDWEDFHRWARRVRREPLPATEETVAQYCAAQLDLGKAVSTVHRRAAAIADRHRQEGHRLSLDGLIRDVLRGARRERGARPQGKAALRPEQLRRMCVALVRVARSATAGRAGRALRDRAMLTLGFAGAMRVSELVSLDVADVQSVRKGLLITIRRSKTDQEGNGRQVGIFRGRRASTCPVRALRAWLKVRGRKPGLLFEITTRAVNQVVKRCCELAGIDPAPYGTHSLRAGFVTEAAENGVPETVIMQRTGHRSVQTVAMYVRPASVFRVDALAKSKAL